MAGFRRSLTRFSRAKTRTVRIGSTVIGGGEPVAPQSMTNTDTRDTEACVAQIGRIHAAGCDIVRLTAQGRREAENLEDISRQAEAAGLGGVALVADIHFTPDVALVAARFADKVRINPGNYDIARLPELLAVCRKRGIPIRIGVNHGSLSPRIVERWGDTPHGMVESAMEFLRECRRHDFNELVVSMKSSNVRVMVHAYRLLAAAMAAEEMDYPLHLGITEAGDGADGRIRSAVGIGALLADGLGDTIRVSLTEPPENEIPVAKAIIAHFEGWAGAEVAAPDETLYSPYEYSRRGTAREGNIGGGGVPVLYGELDEAARRSLDAGRIAMLEAASQMAPLEWRAAVLDMMAAGDARPVILRRKYRETSLDALRIKASCDFGMAFIDGLADGIWIENEAPCITQEDIDSLALSILQASRVRMSKTEYIACPGCGRTLFDLQSTLAAVRRRTSHLDHLKIAVMGCIVNGPGEMADADYGYVGEGRAKVTLYKGRQPMKRGIDQAQAVDELVDLIKYCGDWKEPAR
jgi:(E)-4-hydroxy-3-methylbut-2-enyl-diphosphate synthase